jgi:hypothetical protein
MQTYFETVSTSIWQSQNKQKCYHRSNYSYHWRLVCCFIFLFGNVALKDCTLKLPLIGDWATFRQPRKYNLFLDTLQPVYLAIWKSKKSSVHGSKHRSVPLPFVQLSHKSTTIECLIFFDLVVVLSFVYSTFVSFLSFFSFSFMSSFQSHVYVLVRLMFY